MMESTSPVSGGVNESGSLFGSSDTPNRVGLPGAVSPSLPGSLSGRREGVLGSRRYTFSATTCLQLLESNLLNIEQLRYEREILEHLGVNSLIHASPGICDSDFIKEALLVQLEYPDENEHFSILQNDIAQLMSAVNRISEVTSETNAIARATRPAVEAVSRLADLDASTATSIATAEELIRTIRADIREPLLTQVSEDEVCRVYSRGEIDFSDICVNDVLGELDITDKQSCGRFTAYFGGTSYRYGRVSHPGAPYPSSDVLDAKLQKMHDFDFSPFLATNLTIFRSKTFLMSKFCAL